jgi:hypothetical protein
MNPGANTDFQYEAVAPNGALLLGFFLKPNRFVYAEKLAAGATMAAPEIQRAGYRLRRA